MTTPTTPTLCGLDELGDGLGRAATVLRANAGSAGLTAAVPTCPGWDVGDLVVHTGMVHRWAAARVAPPTSAAGRVDPEELERSGRDAADLLGWFDDGATELLQALADAPDDLDAPVFLPAAPPARLFWARRQCHETTVHAVDALAARLGRCPLPTETWIRTPLARDGIDELLRGFVPRARQQVNPSSAGAGPRGPRRRPSRVAPRPPPGPAPRRSSASQRARRPRPTTSSGAAPSSSTSGCGAAPLRRRSTRSSSGGVTPSRCGGEGMSGQGRTSGSMPLGGVGRVVQAAIYRAGAFGQRPAVPTDGSRLEEVARKHLSRRAFAYIAGSAGSEAGARANAAAFDGGGRAAPARRHHRARHGGELSAVGTRAPSSWPRWVSCRWRTPTPTSGSPARHALRTSPRSSAPRRPSRWSRSPPNLVAPRTGTSSTGTATTTSSRASSAGPRRAAARRSS